MIADRDQSFKGRTSSEAKKAFLCYLNALNHSANGSSRKFVFLIYVRGETQRTVGLSCVYMTGYISKVRFEAISLYRITN